MPSFHGYDVSEGFDLSWAALETGEASSAADSLTWLTCIFMC